MTKGLPIVPLALTRLVSLDGTHIPTSQIINHKEGKHSPENESHCLLDSATWIGYFASYNSNMLA
jgi:hypothetical protein